MQPIHSPEKGLRDPAVIELLRSGVNNAISGLSQMVGRDIRVTALSFDRVPVKNVPDLFGGPECLIVGVYLGISRGAQGHMLVAYHPKNAFDLVDLLLDRPAGSTTKLSEMEQSVLGEVGNIMGSFFLNRMADGTGSTLLPSPPAVMMDMAGAILDGALGSVLDHSDFAYVINTKFGTRDRNLAGIFMVVPVSGEITPCG